MFRSLVLAALLAAAPAALAVADDECQTTYQTVLPCHAAGQESGDDDACTKLGDDLSMRLEADGMESADAGLAGEACQELCEAGADGTPAMTYEEFSEKYCPAQ